LHKWFFRIRLGKSTQYPHCKRETIFVTLIAEYAIILVARNVRRSKEVILMQDPMSFNQFASQLPKVFDTIAKRGEKVLVEKDGMLFRLEPEENLRISGQPMTRRK
jgi:hypothetical protein